LLVWGLANTIAGTTRNSDTPDERWHPCQVVRSAAEVSSVTCFEQATVSAHTQTTQFTDRIDSPAPWHWSGPQPV